MFKKENNKSEKISPDGVKFIFVEHSKQQKDQEGTTQGGRGGMLIEFCLASCVQVEKFTEQKDCFFFSQNPYKREKSF